jgi:hypothetical protein
MSKLRDKKINTLVEKRMVQIAKKSRADTYKDIVMGTFNSHGQIQNLSPAIPTTNPSVCRLDLNITPRGDEDAHGADLVGRRPGTDIWLKGFKCSGIITVAGSNAMVNQRLTIALVSARRPLGANNLGPNLALDYPTSFIWNEMNGALKTESQKEAYSHVQILKKKVMWLSPKAKATIRVPLRFEHFFKRPKIVKYHPNDDQGVYPLNRSYFLVMYTDADHSSGDNSVRFVLACRKYYFTE